MHFQRMNIFIQCYILVGNMNNSTSAFMCSYDSSENIEVIVQCTNIHITTTNKACNLIL